jgi:hypothetical protein
MTNYNKYKLQAECAVDVGRFIHAADGLLASFTMTPFDPHTPLEMDFEFTTRLRGAGALA